MIAGQRGLIEELINELSLIAFGIPKSRDISGEPAVFHRKLDELSFPQEGVHPGNIVCRTALGVVLGG